MDGNCVLNSELFKACKILWLKFCLLAKPYPLAKGSSYCNRQHWFCGLLWPVGAYVCGLANMSDAFRPVKWGA